MVLYCTPTRGVRTKLRKTKSRKVLENIYTCIYIFRMNNLSVMQLSARNKTKYCFGSFALGLKRIFVLLDHKGEI